MANDIAVSMAGVDILLATLAEAHRVVVTKLIQLIPVRRALVFHDAVLDVWHLLYLGVVFNVRSHLANSVHQEVNDALAWLQRCFPSALSCKTSLVA